MAIFSIKYEAKTLLKWGVQHVYREKRKHEITLEKQMQRGKYKSTFNPHLRFAAMNWK